MRAWIVMGVLAAAGLASGQSGDPLRGPSVRVDSVPGQVSTLTGDVERGVRAVPFREFLRSLRVLEGSAASLNADQREQVEEITRGFFAEWREYEREHGEEVGELRAMKRSMSDDPTSQERAASVRERSQEIRKRGPDADGAQKKVWAVLDGAQRALVEAELSVWRDEQEQRREERYLERKGKERDSGADGVPGEQVISDERISRMQIPEQMKERLLALPSDERAGAIRRGTRSLGALREAAGSGSIDAETLGSLGLPERARKRLERLSPEQRAATLGRMLESRERGGRRDGAARDGLNQEKTPPKLDGVRVPQPDLEGSKGTR